MFRSEKHNVFTEDVNEITLNANEDKRIQSIGSIETYAHETNEEIVHKKGETKCINKNTKNDQLLAISPNHSYRILIIGGYGSGKQKQLSDMIKQQDDGEYSVIDNIYLYAKVPNEAK